MPQTNGLSASEWPDCLSLCHHIAHDSLKIDHMQSALMCEGDV